MKIQFLSVLASVLAGLAGIVTGQSSGMVQIRAVLHDPARSDAKFLVGDPASGLVPLNLVAEGLTVPQMVPRPDGTLRLFFPAAVGAKEGKASLAASLKLPAGNRFIVLILPAGQAIPPYRLVAINDSPQDFPWGESKAVNLTPVEFAVEAGEHKIVVKPAEIAEIPKVQKLNEFNRAQTNFHYRKDAVWVTAAERQMQYLDSLRRIFLIYKAPAAVGPDIRTIIDYQSQTSPVTP